MTKQTSGFDPKREEFETVSTSPFSYKTRTGCPIKGYSSLRGVGYMAASIDGEIITSGKHSFNDLMARLELLYHGGDIRRSTH